METTLADPSYAAFADYLVRELNESDSWEVSLEHCVSVGVDFVRRPWQDTWYVMRAILQRSHTRVYGFRPYPNFVGIYSRANDDHSDSEGGDDLEDELPTLQGSPAIPTYDCGTDWVIWYRGPHELVQYADRHGWTLRSLFPGTVYHPTYDVWLAPLPTAGGEVRMRSTRMGWMCAEDEAAVRALAGEAVCSLR
jgi:hypothetical protein